MALTFIFNQKEGKFVSKNTAGGLVPVKTTKIITTKPVVGEPTILDTGTNVTITVPILTCVIGGTVNVTLNGTTQNINCTSGTNQAVFTGITYNQNLNITVNQTVSSNTSSNVTLPVINTAKWASKLWTWSYVVDDIPNSNFAFNTRYQKDYILANVGNARKKVNFNQWNYLYISTIGDLKVIDATDPQYGYYGYSTTNLALSQSYSQVFGDMGGYYPNATATNRDQGLADMLTDATKRTTCISQLVTEANTKNLAGISIDFEPMRNWTGTLQPLYDGFVIFANTLATQLNATGKKLALAMPAMNADGAAGSVNYSDFTQSNCFILPMIYDQNGPSGEHCTINRFTNCLNYTISKVGANRTIAGWSGQTFKWVLNTTTNLMENKYIFNTPITALPNSQNKIRSTASQYLSWNDGTTVYWAADEVTANYYRNLAESLGVLNFAAFQIADYPIFSAKLEN